MINWIHSRHAYGGEDFLSGLQLKSGHFGHYFALMSDGCRLYSFPFCSLIKDEVERPNYDKLQVRIGEVLCCVVTLFLSAQTYSFFTKYDSEEVDVASWYKTVR